MAPPSCKGLVELKNEVNLGNSDGLVTLVPLGKDGK